MLSKADWESFKINSCKLITTDLVSESTCIDDNTEILTNAIIKAAELSIPQGKKQYETHKTSSILE